MTSVGMGSALKVLSVNSVKPTHLALLKFLKGAVVHRNKVGRFLDRDNYGQMV